ncbi:MAG: HNH endonuclease, partial [Dysgonamonadaceae bacterium]|nr:HNH endonuclease [Dysgonamonadaceae bacterium]
QKCCITGLSISDLLVASHIVPWKVDVANRLNPQNGVCLNSIHDKAFDKGYITITPDFKIKLSDYFKDYSKENAILDFFYKYENLSMILPDRFLPSRVFLDYHYNNIFRK